MKLRHFFYIILIYSCKSPKIGDTNLINGIEYWIENSDTILVKIANNQYISTNNTNYPCYYEYFVKNIKNDELILVLTRNKLKTIEKNKDTMRLYILNKQSFNDTLCRAPIYQKEGRVNVLSKNYSLDHKIALGDLFEK